MGRQLTRFGGRGWSGGGLFGGIDGVDNGTGFGFRKGAGDLGFSVKWGLNARHGQDLAVQDDGQAAFAIGGAVSWATWFYSQNAAATTILIVAAMAVWGVLMYFFISHLPE